MVALLGLPLDRFVYLGQVFSYAAPAAALPTAWLVDRHGLRAAALASLLLVAARNGARALLFWPRTAHWPRLKFLYWAVSSCASALVATIYWCLPLKMSESWFPEGERSFAWSCIVAGPMLGMALSSLWTPWAVERAGAGRRPPTEPLGYANLVALALTLLAVGLGVSRSAPREPPSARQRAKPRALHQRPLAQCIKSLLADRDVLLLVLALNSFESAENSINDLMQDILAASGLGQTFCGQFLASVAAASALLQLLSASLDPDEHHPTGNSARCKLYVSLQWLAFAFYALNLTLRRLHRQYWWLMIASSLLYTLCKFWFSPAYNSQMAHLIAGSMSEATVGAAGIIASYLLTNVYTVIFVYFRQADPREPHSSDYCCSILLLLGFVSSSSFLYLACFSGRSSPGQRPAKNAANGGDQRPAPAAEVAACGAGNQSA